MGTVYSPCCTVTCVAGSRLFAFLHRCLSALHISRSRAQEVLKMPGRCPLANLKIFHASVTLYEFEA